MTLTQMAFVTSTETYIDLLMVPDDDDEVPAFDVVLCRLLPGYTIFKWHRTWTCRCPLFMKPAFEKSTRWLDLSREREIKEIHANPVSALLENTIIITSENFPSLKLLARRAHSDNVAFTECGHIQPIYNLYTTYIQPDEDSFLELHTVQCLALENLPPDPSRPSFFRFVENWTPSNNL